jgi:tetratricopeptide (TPR) repeat protein
MVTRKKGEGGRDVAAAKHIPVLARPVSGTSLLEEPTEFEWVPVDGIPLYRVSVYSWDRLMWQGTTSNSSIECPPEDCQFEPGGEYYWVVEGLIGNSALRSQPAKFKMLSKDVCSELSRTLSDENLPVLSKAGLCLSLNLYHKALELADFYVTERPSADAKGYRLRAEIKAMMGLYQDAFFDYSEASKLSPDE